MAAKTKTRGQNNQIYKGLILPVEIIEAISDTLIVCLEHGAKRYKGVLLDSTKCDLPYGVGFTRFHTGDELDLDEIVDPSAKPFNKEAVTKAEVSALSMRHTFAQDPKATDPKLMPTPRSTFPKPLRDKNVRNMRLRPRQVLCSKCKQGMHGDTGKPIEKPEPPPLTMNLRRRRAAEPPKQEPPKKGKKAEVQKEQNKASPVIKISFNTPQGQGTVVVPSKAHGEVPNSEAEETEEVELDQENGLKEPEGGVEDFEKLRKAWKKAKAAYKAKTSAENSENGTKVEAKDTKRGKHKKRKKHKKKEDDTKEESPPPNDQENLPEKPDAVETQQATGATATLPSDGSHVENATKSAESEPGWASGNEIKTEEQDMYSVYDSHFKENSINVPNKFSDDASLANHKTPSRRTSCTDSDSYSQISMNSVSSFVANNEPLKLACYSDISSDDESHNSDGEDNANMNYPDPLARHMGLSMDAHSASPNGACGAEGIAIGRTHPLMMRIQTRNVNKCETDDGRTLMVHDIVWGKIHGFPWWPGKIVSITISQRDNGTLISQTAHVSWYGSSTMSHMPCSELYPFLEDFKLRFNKKKRGPYKVAIKQATQAAQKCVNSPSKMEMIQDCTVDIEMLED